MDLRLKAGRQVGVSTKAAIEFTPPDCAGQDGAPVYLVGLPDVYGRIAYRRALLAAGAVFRTDAEALACLRDGIHEAVVDEQQDEVLAIIERAAAAQQAGELGDAVLWRNAETIQRHVRQHYRPYAELMADREAWLAIAPTVAAEMFLVGWRNITAPFVRLGQRLAPETMAAIPDTHLRAIGLRILQAMSQAEPIATAAMELDANG